QNVSAGSLKTMKMCDGAIVSLPGRCFHAIEAHGAIEKRHGQAAAVGVEVEVAGVVGQLQAEEVLPLVRLPEPQHAAVAAADRGEEAIGVEDHAPGGALEVLLGTQQLLLLAAGPVE